jgi:hypothetical protein
MLFLRTFHHHQIKNLIGLCLDSFYAL